MRKFLYALLIGLGSGRAVAQPRLATAPPTEASPHTLEFVANKGQWPSEVRYAAAVPGGHLCLEPGGLRYVLLEPIEHPHGAIRPATQAVAPTLPAATDAVRGHQLRVRFAGAAADTRLQPSEATAEVRNYLHGNDPAHWASGVPSYRQVRYQAPWPGIGARFYENATQHLEYDFEVAAGADPSRIQLRYEGATALTLSADGQLHVGTSVGGLTELAPRAYQLNPATGERLAVACRYQLDEASATVSFVLGDYNHRRPLVIDPTVLFSTYSGAKGDNWGFTATYDDAGNLYSGGIVLDDMTALPSYPTTAGAFQTTFGGVMDIALIKYNTAANGAASRVWATYIGGNRADFPSSLEVNAKNELLLLGSTASSNYPTTAGAYQRTFRGGQLAYPFGDFGGIFELPTGVDIVVTRLSANGGSLAASTYLGGAGNDGQVPYNPKSTVRQLQQNYGDALRGDIITDSQGNIYIASTSSSAAFPTTAGSFGPTYQGGVCDAVVCKLPASLNALTWSGYLGGAGADAAYSIQVDASSNVYVAGGTLSPSLPGTAGGLTPRAAGNVDGFVARIAANGSAVQRATYLGTSAYDQAFFLQLGGDGGVYVLGQTLGNWPVSAGVYSNAGSRQFIQKLSADLDKSLLSTVFGSGRSTLDISPTAFLVDQCDRVYACGWGGDVNQRRDNYPFGSDNGYTHGMPTTANAVRTAPDNATAGSDFYLAQFAPGLTGLTYGTYYGDPTPGSEGDHVDGGTSRFDPRGVVYAAVCSCFNRSGFPVPPGAYSYAPANGGVPLPGYGPPCNNAAFKLNFEPTVASVGPTQTVCDDAPPIALGGSPAKGIWSGPGVSGSVAAGFVFTPSAALTGTQTLTYTVPGATAACTASARLTVVVSSRTAAATAALPAVCAGSGALALAGGNPAGGVWSGPGVSGSATGGYVFTPTASLVGTQTLTYTLPAALSCTNQVSQATATIQVLPVLTVVLPADTVLCPGTTSSFRLRATPAGGTWSGPGVAAGNVFTPTTPGTFTLTYAVGAGSACPTSSNRRITLLAAPMLAPVAQLVTCGPDSLASLTTAAAVVPYTVQFSLPMASLPTDAVVTWDFGDGTAPATGASVQHTYLTAGTFQPRLVASFNQTRCSAATTLPPLTVQGMLVPNIITPNGDAQNELFAPRLGGCPPRLQVFSRWGRAVYDDAAYRGSWGGAGLAAGLYYYLITPTDGSATIKGWVELVR
jgi:hypothetical protein